MPKIESSSSKPETQNHPNNQMLASWLQTITKTSKQAPQKSLEQQLQTLSLSYKNAQQKLLSLEKQVYYESLHNEKQRSIIDILKYVITGSLDDDTILSYLVQMQDQASANMSSININSSEYETKYEIKSQLQEIKQIVLKQKNDTKRLQSMKSQALTSLKKQLQKQNNINKQLMQDLDRTLNQKYCLESILEELKTKNAQMFQQKEQLNKELERVRKQLQTAQDAHRNVQANLDQTKISLQEYLTVINRIKEQFIRICGVKTIQQNSQANKDISLQILKYTKKVEQKLQKYRKLSKQLSQKIKKSSNSWQLLSVVKQFLPDQAIKLCEQYQKSNQKCLLKEIQGIANLQKKKYNKLQTCQQQVWRLRNRILREDGGSWLKSRNTQGTHLGEKQNFNPNSLQNTQANLNKLEFNNFDFGRAQIKIKQSQQEVVSQFEVGQGQINQL